MGDSLHFHRVIGQLVDSVNDGLIFDLQSVDTKANKLVATIAVGIPGTGGEIAFGEGSVWATVFQIPISRIDPASNAVAQQWTGAGGTASSRARINLALGLCPQCCLAAESETTLAWRGLASLVLTALACVFLLVVSVVLLRRRLEGAGKNVFEGHLKFGGIRSHMWLEAATTLRFRSTRNFV